MTGPQGQPTEEICPECGEKTGRVIEDDEEAGICYGCHLAGLLPPWYEEAEEYEYDKTWRHNNATRKPMTGNELLDSRRKTIYEMLARFKSPPRLR